MTRQKKVTRMPRCVYTCAIRRKRIDIRRTNTVKIAGQDQSGNRFCLYATMTSFFRKFANHEGMPNPLPGLRPYRSRKFPHVRFCFDPVRFADAVTSASGPGFAPIKVFNDLLR